MPPAADNGTPLETPFARARAVVLPAWIDHNGHMNVGFYHVAFDVASEPFFEWLGLTPDVRREHASSTFALESHLHFHREVREGDRLRFEARLLDADAKRLHFFQAMYHADEGYLAATYESLSIHMDMRIRRPAPMPAVLADRVQAVLAAHRTLPRPWQVGHVMSAHPPRRATPDPA
jgi:acyl-CoA thioester hydrolase